MSNNGDWDTDKAVLVGVGTGSGGSGALEGMLNPNNGVEVLSPWVQDPSEEVWDAFLGPNAPRRQIVLLDQNLEKRFQQQYGGEMNASEKAELLDAIQALIEEVIEGCTDEEALNYDPNATYDDGSCILTILGDMNGDEILNVLDVVIIVNMALGNVAIDLIGDLNNDGGINILDVVILTNIILSDRN